MGMHRFQRITHEFMKPNFSLTLPFPTEYYPNLFEWVNQYPERMMDDFWPKNLKDFTTVIETRNNTEQTILVKEGDCPVGFVGYMDCNEHVGSLRGVCFDKTVHGSGIAKCSVRQILQSQFDRGIHKINAFPFVDNTRSIAFYYSLGAKYEGVLREHTIRNGKLTDLLCLAFFAKHDGYPTNKDVYPNFIKREG